ncbi:MAG: photosynthetic reaction center cytochrome PufC [Betaproteobacteria bacterium]
MHPSSYWLKMGRNTFWRQGLWLVLTALLVGCERPPVTAVQGGYRGTAMVQVYNPRTLESQEALNAEPEIARAARLRPGTPLAGDTYENVKVLGDLSLSEFGRTMTAITTWVAPEAGCTYCHVQGNFASDEVYTKVVARRMFQMVQHLNRSWKDHVGETGVTCYTCHRGNNLPTNLWFAPKDRKYANSLMGDLAGQNQPAKTVGLSSLPFDPFTPYLLGSEAIRVNGPQAMAATGAAANRSSTKQAEHTYGLMVHMSESLGVNCTFCHNSRSFQSWEQSTPQRMTAWYGIRMARDLNNAYLLPLKDTFPASRLGPMGDVAKVNCATCHQGAYKPLYGSHIARYYPAVMPSELRPSEPLAAPPPGTPLSPVRPSFVQNQVRQ